MNAGASCTPTRQEAGEKAEQRKNTEAGHRKRAANQGAGDKAGQGKNTEARQRKRCRDSGESTNGNLALGLSPPYPEPNPGKRIGDTPFYQTSCSVITSGEKSDLFIKVSICGVAI